VKIDVSRTHIWDLSGVAALDAAVVNFRCEGAENDIIDPNEATATIIDKLAINDKPDALEPLAHAEEEPSC
jgi:SulP family sulfate permease